MNLSVDIDFKDAEPADVIPDAQLQLLRSRVETELDKPAVILVTSALQGDGKSLTAHSLASCLVSSGRHTALVRVTNNGSEQPNLSMLELRHEDGNSVRLDRLAAFVERMRSNFDYTIVDASAFLSGSVPLELARLVDGILLSVRVGRSPREEDELIVRTIEQNSGRILGVVATEERAVATFARRKPVEQLAIRDRRRGADPKHLRSYALTNESLAQ